MPTVPEADNQPSSSAFPLAEDATFLDTPIILRVSPYAGECRFVRVTLVLIFARAPDLCCLCVASVGRSSPGQPPRLRPGPACRPRPEDRPVGHPNDQPLIQLPLRQAGNYASRQMKRASMDQTRITPSPCALIRAALPVSERANRPVMPRSGTGNPARPRESGFAGANPVSADRAGLPGTIAQLCRMRPRADGWRHGPPARSGGRLA